MHDLFLEFFEVFIFIPIMLSLYYQINDLLAIIINLNLQGSLHFVVTSYLPVNCLINLIIIGPG